jgi:membrane protease YdiL (CAAX protease family)
VTGQRYRAGHPTSLDAVLSTDGTAGPSGHASATNLVQAGEAFGKDEVSSRSSTQNAFRAPDGRIRPGYRLLLFVLVFYAFGGALSIGYRLFRDAFPHDPEARSALVGFALAIVATSAVFVARRRFDHRSVTSLGLGRTYAWSDTVVGFLFSLFFVAATLAIYVQSGWATVSRGTITAAEFVLLALGTAITVAWWEELAFRGYIFQTLREGAGTAVAFLLSCVLYGVVHMLNPNATLGSAIVITTIGALRLMGYLLTGQLWVSIGMHAGWNLAQGAVFGLAVSGRGSNSLLQFAFGGPAWIHGGLFGLEASIAGMAYALSGVLALIVYVRLRGPTSERVVASAG